MKRLWQHIGADVTTDLPFKITERTVVILKRFPVTQCERRSEYLIEDSVFAKVEELLSQSRLRRRSLSAHACP
jgi:hypothetical protein